MAEVNFGEFEWLETLKLKPSRAGWYPIVYAWDAAGEGMFSGAAFWDGADWKTTLPMFLWIDQCLATEDQAYDLAYQNDPEDVYFHSWFARQEARP